MPNTYIKNRGVTQTIVNNNNHKQFNQINWDTNYDGQNANISVTTDTDGEKNHFDITLDNEDLANMLNIPSVSMPLDKRIQMDFNDTFKQDPSQFKIEMPQIENLYVKDRRPTPFNENQTINEIIKSNGYLSSPSPDEEFIVPISLKEKPKHRYTLTPHRTHKTYKVYKKHKSRRKSNSRHKSKSTHKSKSRHKSISKTFI